MIGKINQKNNENKESLSTLFTLTNKKSFQHVKSNTLSPPSQRINIVVALMIALALKCLRYQCESTNFITKFNTHPDMKVNYLKKMLTNFL